MTSTTDADETPRPRRRAASPPAPDAAPPAGPDAPPTARRRRTAAKADDAPNPAPKPPVASAAAPAPAATAPPAPATPAARTRAKRADAAPAAAAPPVADATAAPPTAARRTTTRTAKPAAAAAAAVAPAANAPVTPGPAHDAPGAPTGETSAPAAIVRRTRGRAAATEATSVPSAAPSVPNTREGRAPRASAPPPMDGPPSLPLSIEPTERPAPSPGGGDADGDSRRDAFRGPGRRRRRGRGDGAREPGGYARGPVPPGGDVVRPRDTLDNRARDNNPNPQGGYGRDGGWRRDEGRPDGARTDGGRTNAGRDPRRNDPSRPERRDEVNRYGAVPRADAPRTDGPRTDAPRDDRRQGGQPPPTSSRYGAQRTDGGRGGQQPQGGGRYGGGQRTDAGRGGQRVEGRGRNNGPYRGRDAQRPPAGPPDEAWDAPVPGGLEAGGSAGADWVSYEDRVAGDDPRRSAGQQVTGFIELSKNGNGVLRAGGLAGRNDPVVPLRVLNQQGLRSGDLIEGLARGTQVVEITQVNGRPPVDLAKRPHFDTLTAVHPDKALLVGATADNLTGRLIDLVAPVGRGQRGLIVAPPKAGKTTLLKDIANGLSHDPRLTLLICLVGERPEEVTDMRRSTNCTVLAADMDLPTEDHTRVAEICVEHAKRLVEEGKHVVILMDSLTRLARAYNLSIKGGGSRTLSGGMDASALQPVRKFFGAARCAEGAGSLTILATCLVDTGSRLDDLVYEEFKGTGNMEVHLDRKLSELRLFPAVDIRRSGTRREELLFDAKMLEQVHTMRRQLAPLEPQAALVALLDALRKQPMPDGSVAGR